MCLAQGHNAVTPVRLKPTPWSRVKHSTTEPLCSLESVVVYSLLLDVGGLCWTLCFGVWSWVSLLRKREPVTVL